MQPDAAMKSPKQLDIFIDSESVLSANLLHSALAKGETKQALSAYKALAELEPSHPWLPEAKLLIEALQMRLPKTTQEARLVAVLLDRAWDKAADAMFGKGKHTVLMAMWRAVAENLRAVEFDSEHPSTHPSHAYAKLGAWTSVEWSVRAVPYYERNAILLSRIAEAQWHQSRRVEAIRNWCALCWLAPKTFESMMNEGRVRDKALQDHWAEALDQDFDPPPTGAWFPAWILLKEPGSARRLNAPLGTTPPEAAFATLQQLTVGDPTDTGLRKRLKDLNPGLLEEFLARR